MQKQQKEAQPGEDRDTFKNMEEWTVAGVRASTASSTWIQDHSAVVEAVFAILDLKHIFEYLPENSLGSMNTSSGGVLIHLFTFKPKHQLIM